MVKLKILTEKKESADKNWASIFERMTNGVMVENAFIVDAMERCNNADQAILDYEKSFTKFMKDREGALCDCDISFGDEELDALHEKYRKEYQQIYGKDIKHG